MESRYFNYAKVMNTSDFSLACEFSHVVPLSLTGDNTAMGCIETLAWTNSYIVHYNNHSQIEGVRTTRFDFAIFIWTSSAHFKRHTVHGTSVRLTTGVQWQVL